MWSLQCAVNITNDQFKLALTALLKEALTHCHGPRCWAARNVQVQPHREHTYIHAELQTPCDNMAKAAGHGVFRWVETTLKTAHGLETRIVAFPWELHKETRRHINSFGTLNLNAQLEFSEIRILKENIKKMENISAEVVLPITYHGDFTRQFTSQLSYKKNMF